MLLRWNLPDGSSEAIVHPLSFLAMIGSVFSRAHAHQACTRFEGQFDWIALGDDDTFFMVKRAQTFLKHLDHTKVR